MKRRDFIRIVGVSSGGLMLAAYTPSTLFAQDKDNPTIFSPSVFLKIDSNGEVTVIVHRSEMGQGVRTALPMMVAEELKVPWKSIRIEQADADKKYGSQTTGGSMSVRISWDPFRKAGATAKVMLITAAANKWGVKEKDCYAEDGFVINKKNNKKLSYGELISDAVKLPVPEDVELTDPKDYKIIGKSIPRVDIPDKVYGISLFGIDITRPGMVYAAVQRPPAFGGKVKSFDDTKAKNIKGVSDVLEISRGVAIVADSTYKTFKAKDALTIDWDLGPNKDVNTEGLRNILKENLDKNDGEISSVGNVEQEFPDTKYLEAVYEVPYIAHAPMEPMNCIAEIKDGKAELWVPTQNPQSVQQGVAQRFGLKPENVIVHVTLMGGGFGRRLQVDYAMEAAEIAMKTGKPVKLTWTRKDGMQHGYYRPMSMNKLTARIDKEGNPVLFTHNVVAQSISKTLFNSDAPPAQSDIRGGTDVHYNFPNSIVTGKILTSPIPISWLRSVYNTQNPFAAEAFVDEMAHAAGRDPFEFRRDLLPMDSRLRNVLELAAGKSNWYEKLPEGKGKGIALFSGYDSFSALVAEVSVDKRNNVKVEKCTYAVDCGIVINPNIVKAQFEGGAIFALSIAMLEEITIENGGVVQENFDDFMMLTYEEAPDVEVHIVQNTYRVGGIGEVPVGPAAPALVNAIFAATGKRVRRLPVRLS